MATGGQCGRMATYTLSSRTQRKSVEHQPCHVHSCVTLTLSHCCSQAGSLEGTLRCGFHAFPFLFTHIPSRTELCVAFTMLLTLECSYVLTLKMLLICADDADADADADTNIPRITPPCHSCAPCCTRHRPCCMTCSEILKSVSIVSELACKAIPEIGPATNTPCHVISCHTFNLTVDGLKRV